MENSLYLRMKEQYVELLDIQEEKHANTIFYLREILSHHDSVLDITMLTACSLMLYLDLPNTSLTTIMDVFYSVDEINEMIEQDKLNEKV